MREPVSVFKKHPIHAVPAEPKGLSPARQRLADLLARRKDGEAKLASLDKSLDRLKVAEDAELAARQPLEALDQQEGAIWAEWARSGDGNRPVPDVAARQRLSDALASASAGARAARAAAVEITIERDKVALELSATWREAAPIIREIQIEELEPYFAELQRLDERRLDVLSRIIGLSEAFTEATFTSSTGKSFEEVQPLATLADEITARVRPFTLQLARSDAKWSDAKAEWAKFADRVAVDPSAQFAG